MTLVGARLFVALDARAVSAAWLSGGLRTPRPRGFAAAPLEPGALVPSAAGTNVAEPEAVRAAIRRAVEESGAISARATLVLPDGVARLALVVLPADADARDFVRFRLGPSLPWSADEGAVDALPLGRGRVVGAALRRALVAEYEQLARSAGLLPERVHLAALLALGSLSRSASDGVHVLLSDTCATFAAVRDGRLAAVRQRRRDLSSGEANRVLEEAVRTHRVSAGDGEPPRVVLHGRDATRLSSESGGALVAETLRAPWPGSAHAAWLRGIAA